MSKVLRPAPFIDSQTVMCPHQSMDLSCCPNGQGLPNAPRSAGQSESGNPAPEPHWGVADKTVSKVCSLLPKMLEIRDSHNRPVPIIPP